MASTYTPALSIEKPAQNDYASVGWAAAQDANHDRLDAGYGQAFTLALGTGASGVVNLITYPTAGANAHYQFYSVTGSLAGDVHIIFPLGASGGAVGGRRYFYMNGVTFNNHGIYVRAYAELAAATYGCRFTSPYYLPVPVMVWPSWRCFWDYGASPPGTVIDYIAGGYAPHGWVIADGHGESKAVLDLLFDIIGYGYGGSGASFAVPDLRGRTLPGADNMSGINQGNYTGAGSAGRFFNFGPGGAVGQTQIGLATGNLPSHLHSIADPGHTHSAVDIGHAHTVPVIPIAPSGGGNLTIAGPGSPASTSTGHANISVAASFTGITQTGAVGSGTPFQTVQPSFTTYKLIRA